MRALAGYWLPPLVWMGLIWTLSADIGSVEHTGRLVVPILKFLLPWASPDLVLLVHVLLRKLGHVAEYAVLSVLWFRAIHVGHGAAPASSALLALALSLAWAVVDEFHQTAVASRTGTWTDVVIDAAGAICAALAAPRILRAPEGSREPRG